MEQLGEVEAWCRKLFESNDPTERAAADRALQCFATPEYFLHSRYLLENSNSFYVLTLATTSLTKIISAHWSRFVPTQRAELKVIVHRRLLTLDAATTPSFVLAGVVQLYARLVKFMSLDVPVQGLIAEILEAFLGVPTARAVGLQVLIQLIAEMNQSPPPGITTTQNRKIAMQFRDASLLQIFEMALISLGQLSMGSGHAFGDDDRLCDLCLQLLNKCLSFDFLGTQPDERTEDVGTVQVPASWRSTIEDPKTTDLLFKLYMLTANAPLNQQSASPPRSAQALECVIQLSSIRRSLFNDTERDKLIARLITGICKILSSQAGLQHPQNHHELCRLLMRFRSNFQLAQMTAAESYTEFITLASQFTTSSFRAWPYASRDAAHYYLLHFWSRLAAANVYVRGGPPTMIESFVPKVAEAYFTSRVELAALVVQNPTVEDPLNDEEQLEEQLETLPQLGRCKFSETSAFLLNAFDPLAQAFEKIIASANSSPQAQVVELQLTWLTYLIATILGGRLEAGATEEHDPVDGLLASRIFRLLLLSDNAASSCIFRWQYLRDRRATVRPTSSHEKLERAVLFFLQQFRKVFIGEQAMTSSGKVYQRLADDLGLGDHLHIGTNLKRWGREPRIIEKTLCLFQDLASGYSSGKLLAQLDGINQLLTHHTSLGCLYHFSEYFLFLDHAENVRSRTTYYNTLAKLFLAMDDSAVRFRAFMEPFQVLLGIGAQLIDPNVSRMPASQQRLVGLLRDLRGITDACVSRRSHTLLFDWLYPAVTPILVQAAQVYYDVPAVTTPLLKFYAELVYNKQCRLAFDCSSANGILIFRETSKIICAYGAPTLQRPTGSDPYGEKYKGIWLCMLALTRTFIGNYVCFGVFSLYKDPSLTDALSIVLKLATSIPLADGVLHYPKVCKAFFNLIEALTEHHMPLLGEVDTPTFVHLVFALKEALRNVDQAISGLACLALDNVASYHHRSVKDGNVGLTAHFTARHDILPSLLLAMCNITLFDETANLHCLSRPIFSVICIVPHAWSAFQEELLSRNVEHRAELSTALETLKADLHPVLDARNRDKFSSNLANFRQSTTYKFYHIQWVV